MRLYFAIVFSAIAGILGGGALLGAVVEPIEAGQWRTPSTLAEDDPGWQCWSMGNLLCGRPGDHIRGTQLTESWDR